MIKINLLPQKRGKTRAARAVQAQRGGGGGSDTGTRDLMIGLLSIAGAGVLVFLLMDLPARGELSDLKAEKARLTKEVNDKKTDKKISVGDYDTLVQQKADAVKKIQATRRLMQTRIVPANVLQELGQILTVRGPTMTQRMNKLTEQDPQKKIPYDWDPTHVWITAWKDTGGSFALEGGAQSKEDVTQLQKRMAASVYFLDVSPSGGEQVADKDTGLAYYKFTITGKVVY